MTLRPMGPPPRPSPPARPRNWRKNDCKTKTNLEITSKKIWKNITSITEKNRPRKIKIKKNKRPSDWRTMTLKQRREWTVKQRRNKKK